MLTPGHLAASYLISQTPRLKGYTPTIRETIFIVAAGYILDLDILIAPFFGVKASYHHFLPTHTPLFVFLIFAISFIFLKNKVKPLILWLDLVAILSHLILDDIGYWFQLLGWQEESKIPQIFWFYPFDWRRVATIQQVEQSRSGYETVALYLNQARANMVAELLLVVAATSMFFCLRSHDSRVKSSHARI